jgi:hypothetical protein
MRPSVAPSAFRHRLGNANPRGRGVWHTVCSIGPATSMDFRDRADAGRELAGRLAADANRGDVLAPSLPRGGGCRSASRWPGVLGTPLDVILVRKLGVPGHEELAMGAVASGGVRVLNLDVVEAPRIPDRVIDARGHNPGRVPPSPPHDRQEHKGQERQRAREPLQRGRVRTGRCRRRRARAARPG